jgi:ribosomal protein S18 acetylase RimI-like enzyme
VDEQSQIISKPYTSALAHEVVDFDCGTERWASPLNDFIRNEASKYMKRLGTKIWLYDNDLGERVGYGSIGVTKWTILPGETDRQTLVLLPNIAVRIEQQRKGYAKQICNHLIAEAQAEYDARKARGESIIPFLGLLVHPENLGAKKLYSGVGFSDHHYTYYDSSENVRYEGMGMFLKPYKAREA